MDNERFQTLINFGQFFIGTFALGVITLLVNNKIQEREIEIKEQDQIGTLVEKALDENVEARLRLARFYSSVTRSDAIRARWVDYRKELETEFSKLQDDAKKKQEEIDIAKKNNASALEIEELKKERDDILDEITPKTSTLSALPARVYFHISNESQRQKLQEISKAISVPSELIVPGIELRSNSPSNNELRYFKLAEKEEAEKIAQSINKSLGVNVQSKYIPGYEDSKKIRPRHFELWISKLK